MGWCKTHVRRDSGQRTLACRNRKGAEKARPCRPDHTMEWRFHRSDRSGDHLHDDRNQIGVIPANAPRHAATVKAQKKRAPAAQITQWNGGFTDLTGRAITFTMIGTDPATTNAP